MVKLLGFIDIMAAMALFSVNADIVHVGAFLFLMFCLIIKAGMSFKDIGGITDIVAFFVLLASFFITLPASLVFVVAVIMMIKGGVSLFS